MSAVYSTQLGLQPAVLSNGLSATGTAVYHVLTPVNTEWDQAATQPQAKMNKTQKNLQYGRYVSSKYLYFVLDTIYAGILYWPNVLTERFFILYKYQTKEDTSF